MVQLDGKTVDQIIEYFKKDTTGIRGLAFVPVFDDSPEKIKEILLRFKNAGFTMPNRIPGTYFECIFIDLNKKTMEVGIFEKYGIRIYSVASCSVLEGVLDYFYPINREDA